MVVGVRTQSPDHAKVREVFTGCQRLDDGTIWQQFGDGRLILTDGVIRCRRWCWDEEDVPSDLIASRKREAALIFDNLRNGVE
jgi:hypothetical protein